ncbi:hypothetical protein ACI79G_03290 [Geodermatophilus sp. SYSU D00779]
MLTGQTPGAAAAAGFRRVLADPAHRVGPAVLPGPNAPDGGEPAVGPAVLGVDPLSVVLGVPQVTVDDLVVHRGHRRGAAAVAYASEVGAAHVVGAVGGHEAERQCSSARMGSAPLTTRRIVPRETLARTLAARQRGGGTVAVPRRPRSAVVRRPGWCRCRTSPRAELTPPAACR